VPTEQELVVDVASVHGHDAVHGQVDPAGDREVTALALCEHHNSGDVASMVKEGMHRDGPFGGAETSPGNTFKHREMVVLSSDKNGFLKRKRCCGATAQQRA
jgi:hypothetical protein